VSPYQGTWGYQQHIDSGKGILKFQGELEPTSGMEKQLDKEPFILTLTQLITKYGQEQFFLLSWTTRL